jgi:hypothetical protein
VVFIGCVCVLAPGGPCLPALTRPHPCVHMPLPSVLAGVSFVCHSNSATFSHSAVAALFKNGMKTWSCLSLSCISLQGLDHETTGGFVPPEVRHTAPNFVRETRKLAVAMCSHRDSLRGWQAVEVLLPHAALQCPPPYVRRHFAWRRSLLGVAVSDAVARFLKRVSVLVV